MSDRSRLAVSATVEHSVPSVPQASAWADNKPSAAVAYVRQRCVSTPSQVRRRPSFQARWEQPGRPASLAPQAPVDRRKGVPLFRMPMRRTVQTWIISYDAEDFVRCIYQSQRCSTLRRGVFPCEDFARDFRDFLQTAPQQVDLVSCQHPGSRCDTEPPIESGNRRRSRNGFAPTFRGLSRGVGRVHGAASPLVHPRASLSAGSGVYNPHCGSVCRLKMIPRPFRLPSALRSFDLSTGSRHRTLRTPQARQPRPGYRKLGDRGEGVRMGTPDPPYQGGNRRTRRSDPHPSPLPEGEGILLFILRSFDTLRTPQA